MRRVRTSPDRDGEFPTSNLSCTAVETLFTFWPPGPEARTKWSFISLSSIERDGVTVIMDVIYTIVVKRAIGSGSAQALSGWIEFLQTFKRVRMKSEPMVTVCI